MVVANIVGNRSGTSGKYRKGLMPASSRGLERGISVLRSDGNTRWMRVDLLLKWLLCGGIGIVGFWAGHCMAYEAWKGEPTVKLNVRQGPGSGNPVITQIDEGAAVTITDEKEGWYKVVIEEDAYGFIGWVFGKYIRESKPIAQTSSGPDIPKKPAPATAEGPVTASGAAPAAAGPSMVWQAPGEDGGREGGSEATVQRPETRTGQPSEKNTQEMTVAAVPRARPAQGQAPSRDGNAGPHSEKGTPLLVPSEATFAPGAGAVPRQDQKEKPRWRGVLGVVVKLVVVAFSCLALILAYRAWQMASASSRE
jgi:uncharacterized protein YraI